MSRAKWEERVEYIEVTADDSTEKCKIIVSNGGNGDLYVTVCPKDHRGGHTVRIERSGGASTKNPRLVEALTIAYDAIAENEEQYDIKTKGLNTCTFTVEDLIEQIQDINILARTEKERNILKQELLKNFKNEYKIVDKK